MGEGDRASTGEALSRRPRPEPKTGHSPVAAGLREGARAVPSTKPRPASERATLLGARAHPPPDGRRSPSSCQAEAGEAESHSPPSPRCPASAPGPAPPSLLLSAP